jgi:hypothetical protein
MKINKRLLKQMIAEEMATFNAMSEQEEEQAQAGDDVADEPPAAAGGIDADKALQMKLPQFVQALQSNQEAVIKAVLGGLKDGGADDDKVNIVPSTVPIKNLRPTQSEVVFSKSIPFALENPEVFMKYHSGNGPFKVGPEGNDAIITLNGKFILDGHHRWSSLYSINPDASMHTFDIQVPGLKPLDALKLMQASIKAHAGNVPSNKGGGVNLFQIDSQNLRKGVRQSANPENLQKLINLGFLKSGNADAMDERSSSRSPEMRQAMKKLLNIYRTNIARMKTNNPPVSGASSREPMPQTDKPSDSQVTAGGSTPAALEPLEKGQIDFKKPFAKGDKKGEQEMQESKKDMLKRIVAEEVAKMEIEAIQKEGFFSRLGARFGRANKDFPKYFGEFKTALDDTAEKMNYGRLSSSGLLDVVDVVYDFYGNYKDGMAAATGVEYGWTQELNKDQQEQHDEQVGRMRRIIEKLYKKAEEQGNQEAADKARELERQRYRDMEREREEREARQRERERSSSSSSSRKSGFDKWQSGEGDNYNYMTRMESISKKQLAKIVKEELAQLKK